MDPFSQPPQTPISVVIPEPPRKRRAGRIIAIAVVAVAVIGGVAFAVTRGDDTPTYSLIGAQGSTDDVKSMVFTITTEGFGSEVIADIEADVEHGLTHFSMDFGSDVVGLGGGLEMIVDIENKMTYVNGSFFEVLGFPLETEWLSMDEEWLSDNGQDTVFDAEAIENPLDATVAVKDALKTEDLGFDEVEGVKVKHYRVTFRAADLFAQNEQLEAQFDDLDADVPDEIVYEFYVDEQNLVRRITYQLDLGTGEVTTDMVIVSINEPVNIEIPDDDDVTAARDFL